MPYSLTLWMTLVLLVLVAEAFWAGHVSIPFWMAGLLPPAMMLAARDRGRASELRTLHTASRRS